MFEDGTRSTIFATKSHSFENIAMGVGLRLAQAVLAFVIGLIACTLIFAFSSGPYFLFWEAYSSGEDGNPNPNPNWEHAPFKAGEQAAQPVLYNLTIIPDLQLHRFIGEVSITFTTSSPVSSVFLHLGADIVLDNSPYDIERFPASDDMLVYLGVNFTGNFTIFLSYTSNFSQDNHGFYGTFDTVSEKVGAATQFEATHARRVFPCYDTPYSRSAFSLSLLAPDTSMAISNMPPRMIELHPNGRMYHFHTTPAMPPYLLAFAVGYWDMISGFTARGIPIDVYTPVGQAQRGEFALTIAADSIDFFEDYLDVPYPLPRLQLASIPDFAPGAMENWGLVTFRDTALLGVPGDTAHASLARIADIVVHENYHMWAGDLVSPKSWADLWLNEGFASMLPLLCLTSIAPAYSSWSDFRRLDVQEAIAFDFSQYTHPIRLPDESATPQFDSVTYSKGATVLYMLRAMMGDVEFRVSLKQYFAEYKFGSASTQDLVASIDGSSVANVTSFMRVWTERPGFPTITVSRTTDGFLLRQRRLTIDGTEIEGVWPLPISISGRSSVLMNEETLTVVGTGLMTFNDGREAMAMIEYDKDLLPEVLAKFKDLSAGARWMLIEDLRLLVLARRTSPGRLWSAVESVSNETDLDVVETGLGATPIFNCSHLAVSR
jgi:aminopeptidase N